MNILLALIASLVVAAFLEYTIHRWLMHNKKIARSLKLNWATYERHAILHHGRFYQIFDHELDAAAKHISIDLDVATNVLISLFIWMPLIFINKPAAFCFLGVATLHSVIWTAIHREMHEPKGRWFSKTWYYKKVRDNHFLHHKHQKTNFNVVFPGTVDRLFGTYMSWRDYVNTIDWRGNAHNPPESRL